MCYAKVDGGYRCMPSQWTLKLYRGPNPESEPKVAAGAYWLKPGEPLPTLEDLRDEAASLRYAVPVLSDDPDERAEQLKQVELDTMHLGNMICRYSDSQIENFDERLKHAQRQAIEHHLALFKEPRGSLVISKLYRRAVDENLALGYEVRERLRDTLAQIVPFGKKIDIRIDGDAKMSSLLQESSLYFPSNWNEAMEARMKANFVDNADASWYSSTDNSIQITNGEENFVAYPDMASARQASAQDRRKYETQVERVHELSHKFESMDSSIGMVSKEFIRRRALPVKPYRFDEEGEVEDHFASPYVGTIYGHDQHFEVLSMGMESSFVGTNGSLIGLSHPANEDNPRIIRYRSDIEHRNLTVGILAGTMIPIHSEHQGKPFQTIFGMYDPNEFRI